MIVKYPRLNFSLVGAELGERFSCLLEGKEGRYTENWGVYGAYYGNESSVEDESEDDDSHDDDCPCRDNAKQKAKDNIHAISNLVTECEDIKSGTILEIQNLLKKLFDFVNN